MSTQLEREASFKQELSLLRGEVEALTKQAVAHESGHPAADLQFQLLEQRLHKAMTDKEAAVAAHMEDKKELLGRLEAFKAVDDLAVVHRVKELRTQCVPARPCVSLCLAVCDVGVWFLHCQNQRLASPNPRAGRTVQGAVV